MMYFILSFGLVLFGVVCCLGFFSVWIECHWCLKGNPLLVEINTGKTRQNKIICKTKIEIQLIRRALYIYIYKLVFLWIVWQLFLMPICEQFWKLFFSATFESTQQQQPPCSFPCSPAWFTASLSTQIQLICHPQQ